MSGIVTGVLAGLVVVFLGWLAKTAFFSRRLFLIQPKLFDYSDLVNAHTSKTVELTVFNGGVRSEEDIKVQLSPSFRYTVLASDKAGLVVDGNGILSIDRLAPKQDSTVILTAEGGEFRKEHVVGITSKECVGKIKDKLQEAQLTPVQNAAALLVFFVLFPGVGYGVGKVIETTIWPSIEANFLAGTALGYTVTNVHIVDVSAGAKTAKERKEVFEVVSARRNGDVVTLSVKLHNPTKDRLQVTLISTTPVSEDRNSLSTDHIVSDVFVFPEAVKTIEISDYLPLGTRPQLIGLQVILESPEGRSDVTQDIKFEPA
jgi:hypothetical protein